jgi:hypothetical protein
MTGVVVGVLHTVRRRLRAGDFCKCEEVRAKSKPVSSTSTTRIFAREIHLQLHCRRSPAVHFAFLVYRATAYYFHLTSI